MQYLILQHPGHNRVFFNTAGKLALAELQIASQQLSEAAGKIDILELEGIRYLSLETAGEISEDDIETLSALSFTFAIFRLEKVNGKDCLLPIEKACYEYLDGKISSLLKYQGKTNELFTKMMINVGLLSSDFDASGKIRLLDPVAGKGTTLFEATVYGYDAYGIEIDPKAVHEAAIFFKKYLETERIKHQAEKRRITGASKSDAVSIHEFKYANSKEDFKSKETVKNFGLICGDSRDAGKYFSKNRFHLLVGDLPYGIFHGSSGDRKSSSATRNPSELLNDCLPSWYKVLKPGGTAVLAWNSFIVSRKKLSEVFSATGFEILDTEAYREFEHMVDKSIKRDILVARKS